MSEAEKDTRELRTWTVPNPDGTVNLRSTNYVRVVHRDAYDALEAKARRYAREAKSGDEARLALTAALEDGNPGGWRAVANDFQRAMFDERARAERAEAALAEALDVIAGIVLPVERLRSHQEQIDGRLAREDAAVFLGKHGRIPV